jgi:hypothetical protein
MAVYFRVCICKSGGFPTFFHLSSLHSFPHVTALCWFTTWHYINEGALLIGHEGSPTCMSKARQQLKEEGELEGRSGETRSHTGKGISRAKS